MYSDRIKTIVKNSRSIHQALRVMVEEFGGEHLKHLAWGFAVHLHGHSRNDSLFCHTFGDPSISQAFQAAGGTSTDVVATQINMISEPFQIDIVLLAEHQRDTGDLRLRFTKTLLANDLKMAWICPINEPWAGGTGVFNQFYHDKHAEPAIPISSISEVAHVFHDEIRRHRLIAKEIDLKIRQVEFLSEVAKGKSAEDLADKYQVSSRAIEKRLEKIRKALKARNTLEAVYKATIYGVLPYMHPKC